METMERNNRRDRRSYSDLKCNWLLIRHFIPGEWTSHELRHMSISLLADAAVPLERIADQVGHVDTRQIERVYRHRLGTPVDVAVGVMDELFA